MRRFLLGLILLCFSGLVLGGPLVGFGAIPNFQTGTDAASGATWLTVTAYNPRDGGGSFLEWLTPNRNGIFVTSMIENVGLIDATPGAEQGDWEMYVQHKGQMFVNGYGYGLEFDGASEAFFPTTPEAIDLGKPNFLWRSVYAATLSIPTVPCPPSAKPATQCIIVSGGFVPVFH